MSIVGARRRREWSTRETARLLSARKRGMTYAQCASILGRTPKQVKNKLYKLGATNGNSLRGKRQYEIRWSGRDETVMRLHYSALGPSFMAERLRRTFDSVSTKAIKLGLATPKPRWCYADVLELLITHAPACKRRLTSNRSVNAIVLLKKRLRKLFETGRLCRYLKQRPGAPRRIVEFSGRYPPGLKFAGVRLTKNGKAKRARDYLAREAERERQKGASKKWQAQKAR